MRVSFLGLTLPPDTASVGSAGDFMVLSNLLRPLLVFGSEDRIRGDALERWSSDGAFSHFDLTLREGIRFSNGDLITATDVAETLRRMQKVGRSIHYDFGRIASIMVKSPNVVSLALKEGDRNFMRALTAPEFSPMHCTDYTRAEPTFSVTSGAYFLDVVDKGSRLLHLRRNPHFPHSGEPSITIFSALQKSDMLAKERLAATDLFPGFRFNMEEHNLVTKEAGFHARKVNLGFSYFLSLNPQSPLFSDVLARRWVQAWLHPSIEEIASYTPLMASSSQLYLPDGPGRLKREECERFWQEGARRSRPDSLRMGERVEILMQAGFVLRDFVEERLRSAGFRVKTTTFETWSEFPQLIKNPSFDIVQANNDFSSREVLESLKVTFNPARPLILLPEHSKVRELLEVTSKAEESQVCYQAVEEIGRALLEEGLVVPMFHDFLQVYHRPEVDLNDWNPAVPEVPLWKVRTSQQRL